MASKYPVAGCALRERDHRLLRMVMSGTKRYELLDEMAAEAQTPDLAIVDIASPESISAYRALKARNGRLVPVAITENGGAQGEWVYAAQRSSLLRSVFPVLDSIVSANLWDSAAAPAPVVQPVVAPVARNASQWMQPIKALVVDDSLAVRESLRAALERMGVRSDLASDADDALNLLNLGDYELILLDVVMPGMDGYELCRKIKQNPHRREVPVLMLTSRSSPFDRVRGKLVGCDSYLTKPVSWDAFSSAVDKALLKYLDSSRDGLFSRGYSYAG